MGRCENSSPLFYVWLTGNEGVEKACRGYYQDLFLHFLLTRGKLFRVLGLGPSPELGVL